MDKDEILAHKEQRKKLWCNVWVGVATSSNSVNIDTGTRWADKALEEFDKRFPMPINLGCISNAKEIIDNS